MRIAPRVTGDRDLQSMDTPLLDEHKITGATLAPFHGVTLPEQFTSFATQIP